MTLTSAGNVAATMKHVATLRVWPILEDLIRIADAADIPICGGVLGVMTYLIDLFNEAQDNKDAHAQLKSTLESYMKTLNDFVSVFPPAYLSHSKAQDATLARDAIRAFDR
ncbi:hypothetical protein FRB99_005768 [Tulasnella sp. 403]|nr:hypothetical protein FRB99_005768 [Tulasnella sp. 403]